MGLTYDKTALQEYINDLSGIGALLMRARDESISRYQSCRQLYTRLYSEAEQAIRNAANQLEDTESMRRSAEARAENAMRMLENSDDEQERAQARDKLRDAHAMEREAEEETERAAAALKAAEDNFEHLASAWGTKEPRMATLTRQIEDRFSAFVTIADNCNRDLGEYIGIMDRALTVIYEGDASEAGGGPGGSSVHGGGIAVKSGVAGQAGMRPKWKSANLASARGIRRLVSRHPELKVQWERARDAVAVLNDPDVSPLEIRSVQPVLNGLKGRLFETAVKDALQDRGLNVERQQRMVPGEHGNTKPDIVAVNNAKDAIDVFGISVPSGETISIECKCGGEAYLVEQLKNHIPNQLSGQSGIKVLMTTNDVEGSPAGLARETCDRYGARLVVVAHSSSKIDVAIKGGCVD